MRIILMNIRTDCVAEIVEMPYIPRENELLDINGHRYMVDSVVYKFDATVFKDIKLWVHKERE